MAAREFGHLFFEETGLPLREKVGLDAFSSFRIGGPADFFFEARTGGDLKKAVSLAVREKFPFFVIGGGFNILFDDAGYRGLIIRNQAQGVSVGEGRIGAVSGTPLGVLLQAGLAAGLAGLEFLAGIPGSVGGALAGNAGAFGRSIGELVEEAVVLGPDGVERTVARGDLGFGYRTSALRGGRGVILGAAFAASPGDRKTSEGLVRDYLEQRKTKHPPWGTACAGSYFKNPCGVDGCKVAAGRLLEQAGARGLEVGGAAVYPGHCNFIINTGKATAADVLRLAAELKERVLKQSGILLEEEVIRLPAAASTP